MGMDPKICPFRFSGADISIHLASEMDLSEKCKCLQELCSLWCEEVGLCTIRVMPEIARTVYKIKEDITQSQIEKLRTAMVSYCCAPYTPPISEPHISFSMNQIDINQDQESNS